MTGTLVSLYPILAVGVDADPFPTSVADAHST